MPFLHVSPMILALPVPFVCLFCFGLRIPEAQSWSGTQETAGLSLRVGLGVCNVPSYVFFLCDFGLLPKDLAAPSLTVRPSKKGLW